MAIGHNVVDTVVAVNGSELVVDFDLQPKGSAIPKTKRAATQLLRALAYLRSNQTPDARIRILMDGGYTNTTVLPSLRKENIKYIGTIIRTKTFDLFGEKKQLKNQFSESPSPYLTINGNKIFYAELTLNLHDLGRHTVFAVKRSKDLKVKFVLTNDLKMTPRTFLSCLSERWWIEQNHRDLKQYFGLRQLFVQKKSSVKGIIGLSILIKNFLALLLAESGSSFRDCPLETLIEKEFSKVEQDFLQKAFNAGLMEELMTS